MFYFSGLSSTNPRDAQCEPPKNPITKPSGFLRGNLPSADLTWLWNCTFLYKQLIIKHLKIWIIDTIPMLNNQRVILS